jgi:hypothetical protein
LEGVEEFLAILQHPFSCNELSEWLPTLPIATFNNRKHAHSKHSETRKTAKTCPIANHIHLKASLTY